MPRLPNLLRQLGYVLSDQVVALWVVQDWEAVRIAKGDEVGLAGVEAHVHHLELRDLFLSYRILVDPFSK